MPAHRLLAASAATLLLALAPTAADAVTLPVGSAQGVRLTSARTGAVFHFADRAAELYRTIAGRRVDVACTRVSRSQKLGIHPGGTSVGTTIRAPRRRAPLRTGLVDARADWCSVSPAGEQRPLVSVPLTQAGAVTLDEQEKAALLSGALLFAGTLGDRTTPSAYPTPARFLASRYARLFADGGIRLVALAAPTDTPPARAVGYWSDGRRSAAVVTLSAVGRRLFLQLGPDDAVSTNMPNALG